MHRKFILQQTIVLLSLPVKNMAKKQIMSIYNVGFVSSIVLYSSLQLTRLEGLDREADEIHKKDLEFNLSQTKCFAQRLSQMFVNKNISARNSSRPLAIF